jgi:hypothetical protein
MGHYCEMQYQPLLGQRTLDWRNDQFFVAAGKRLVIKRDALLAITRKAVRARASYIHTQVNGWHLRPANSGTAANVFTRP